MKRRLNLYGWILTAWAATGFAACSETAGTLAPDKDAPVQQEVIITAGTAAMTFEGLPSTRSIEPMGPESENPIKQLAVIQFDEEGNLLDLKSGGTGISSYFYWKDFTNDGELPGNLSITEEDDFRVPLYTGRQTRVCLLGNLSKEEVETLVTGTNGNPVNWAGFLEKTVEVDYILEQNDPDGEVGHVRQIHLFGYYEGVLGGNNQLDNGDTFVKMDFTLARLIARLELAIRLGEGVKLPDGYRIYFGLKGVEEEVYLFPNLERTSYVHKHVEVTPIDRTEEIRGGQNTFYFYVAPHLVLADSIAKATRLQIWCTTETNLQSLEDEDAHEVLICNDPLQETPTAAGSLWINRNSIYHMNLTLTYEGTKTQSKAGEEKTLVVPIIPPDK